MTASHQAIAPSRLHRATQPKRLALAVKLALSTLLIPAAHAQTQEDNAAAATGNLPEVTVSAKKETTTTVITSEDMARSAVTDMAGVIRYQPLVTAPSAVSGAANLWDGTGTSGYNIRGVEGNRIGLDVDGVELPSSVPLPDGLKATGVGIGRDYIDPEMFRRVDISSGTTNAGENGATGLGGRVSFITKSPDDYLVDGKTTYYGAKLGYTSADKAWAEALTAAAKVGDWKLLGVYSRRDGELTQPKGVNDPDTDSWHSDALLLKAIYGGLAHHKIGITLDMYQRTDNRFLDGATYSAYPAGANQHSTTSRHRIQLDDEFTPAGGYALFDKLRTYAYYQDSKKDDYTVAANSTNTYTRYIDTYLSTTSAGIGADATKRLGAHDIFYGLSLNVLDEKRPWTEARYTNATGALVTGYPYTKDRMAATQTDKLVAYIRDDWHLSPRATLTPGLRGEYWHTKPGDLTNYLTNVGTASSEIKSDNTAFLAPSLRLAYALTPTYDFYAQYSRGVRVATAAEKTGTYDSSTYSASAGFLYAILGNPNLKNETSDAFEIGTKGEIAHGLTLNGSLFYTKYKNFIDYQSTTYAGVSPAYRLQNIANVDIWGGEISTRFDLGAYASALQGYSVGMAAGVSYGHSKNEDGKTGSVNSVGPAKGNIRLAYDDPSKRYGGSFIMSSARGKRASSDDVSVYSTSGAYFNVPGYTVFDLSTYWKLASNVTLNAGIYNLTDKKYWDYATVRALTTSQSTLIQRAAQPGRNVGLSLNVEM